MKLPSVLKKRKPAPVRHPVELVSAPVRFGIATSVVISVGIVTWAFFAKIPIYVNGYAYMVKIGGESMVPSMEEGKLHYQFSQSSTERKRLFSQLWEVVNRQIDDLNVDIATITKNLLSLPVDANHQFSGKPTKQIADGTILFWVDSQGQRAALQSSLNAHNLAVAKLDSVKLEYAELNKALQDKKLVLDKIRSSEVQFLEEIARLNKIGYAGKARLLQQQSKVDQLIKESIEISERIAKNAQAIVNAEEALTKADIHLINQLQEYIARCMYFTNQDTYIGDLFFPQLSVVNRGDVILSTTQTNPEVVQEQIVGFLSQRDADQASRGMKALLTPMGMDKAEYGGIQGDVLRVWQRPITDVEISEISGDVGIGKDVIDLVKDPVMAEIRLFKTDQMTGLNQVGFEWSSAGDKPFAVRTGDLLSLQITTRRIPPISLLLPWLKTVTGLTPPETSR